MDEIVNSASNMGIVKISDDVVSVIAGLAAGEIKGIAGMTAGITGGITQIFSGKKNVSKGVKVNVGEDSASIDMILAVEYGIRIPELARTVQENVKKAVESMTGLKVSAVNIFIQSIILSKADNAVELKEE